MTVKYGRKVNDEQRWRKCSRCGGTEFVETRKDYNNDLIIVRCIPCTELVEEIRAEKFV